MDRETIKGILFYLFFIGITLLAVKFFNSSADGKNLISILAVATILYFGISYLVKFNKNK